MRVQTITRETLAKMTEQQMTTRATPTDAIIAQEGSELASRLRSRGWVARSGWRSRPAGRPAVWLVRFEQPAMSVTRDAWNESNPRHASRVTTANHSLPD